MSKKHIGSHLDAWLEDEGLLDEVTAVALKRVIAWQIAEEMKTQQLTKTALAKRMHTSRAALNRLLDEEDASLTLTTLASAAAALGKTVSIHLAPADGGTPAPGERSVSRAAAPKTPSRSSNPAKGSPSTARPQARTPSTRRRG